MRSLLSLIAVTASLPVNTLALTTSRIRNSQVSPLRSSATATASPICPPRISNILESTVEETLEQTSTANTNEKNHLSPFLQGMVDEQRELQMNVGKAMDVLRKDYPYFLKRAPDYSIYHDSISLSASDGQNQVSKLSSYKKAFSFTRTMLSLLYDTDRSVIQSRMVYDSTRTQIRVSFNAMLVPKMNMGAPVHVDGISVYLLDLSSTMRKDGNGDMVKNEGAGKIIEHKIEKLLVNGAALQPPYFNLEMITGSGQQHGGALVGAGAWSYEL